MADPRTFVLIGEFKDGITPELAKINNELAKLKANFAGIGSRKNTGFRGATQEIGKLVSAHKKLSESIKGVEGDLRSTVGVLQQYRREMGKAASATRAFQKAGGNLGGNQFKKDMGSANKAAQAYLRTLQQINAQSRRMPRGGVGGGFQPPRPPRGGGGYGGGLTPPTPPKSTGGGAGMGAHMGEFGFAYTLGSNIAQPIQNAIVAGFQIGVSFMVKPFEYFAKSLQERIDDEQSDIKAAGGIFSIARRQESPFVKTMDEAMEFTQANNKYLAELAAALPGNTQQYIEVSKKISDSISRIVTADPTKAIEYSNKLREEEGKQALSGSRQAQTKGAITQLLGEMTKKTVLAGLGTGGGPGGVAGAYGLPQLTERMLTQQEVSMGQFQRYAAIFKDPLIMDALNRFIPKINASAAGTMERFEVMAKFYDEVLPKEMIRKFERSTAGVLELFNTTIFGPETGLFGLGRKMGGMGKMMDDYGNYIKEFEDGTRKVVTSFAEASDANLSLFDLLRDSFANLGIALYPILQNLGAIFDPINKVAKLLVDFRHASGEFLNAFESYKKGFEDMVKEMDKAGKEEFMKIGLDLRASLAAVNNFFANAGIIDENQFQANAKHLMSTTFDYKKMISGMLDTLLNSDAAAQFGELIGEIIGTVLTEVAKVTGFISGRISSSSKLFTGLKKGFEEAGGTEAFKNIFKDVFTALFNALKELARVIPLEAYFMAGLAVLAPAVVQGLAMSFASRLWSATKGMMDTFVGMVTSQIKNQASRVSRVKPVTVTDLGAVPSKPQKLLPPAKTPRAALPGADLATKAAKGGWFANLLTNLKNLGRLLTTPIKAFGKFNVALMALTGAIEFVSTLLSGGDIGEALGKAAGPAIGMAIGGALLGPLGAMIGGWIGSLKPVTDSLTGIFKGIWWGLTEAWNAIGPVLDGIGGILVTVWNGIMGLIPGMDHLGSNLDFLNMAFITVKIALFPFISAINGVAFALQGLKLGLLYLDKWINSTFQFGDRQGRIQAEIDKTSAQIQKIAENQNRLNQSLLQPLPTQKNAAPGAPATTAPSPIFTPAAAPVAPIQPVTPPEVKQTAQSTASLDSKATTHLATAAATGQTAAKTTQNTTVANTHLINIKSAAIAISNKIGALQTAILGDLNNIQAGVSRISSLLASGNLKVKTDFNMPGGLPGGGSGGPAIFGAAAQKFGLQMTSGYRPGDPGYHGINRARDYSNGSGPTPQMMAFAQYLYSTFGSNLKELIYTPLGFSIKNGQKVPPYAQAAHYNHVHVAWALGPQNPVGFGSLGAAQAWENSMIPGSAKVASITANSTEGFGSTSVGDIYVTVNAGATNDPDQLAYMVAERIQAAVGDAVNSNILV